LHRISLIRARNHAIKNYLVKANPSTPNPTPQGYRAGDNLKLVSLGQGQGPIAERLVAEGIPQGHWVCLQNCHLAVSWLPRLDRLVENLRENEAVHDDFRLWLTTMPTPKFPVPVLQSSLKLTQVRLRPSIDYRIVPDSFSNPVVSVGVSYTAVGRCRSRLDHGMVGYCVGVLLFTSVALPHLRLTRRARGTWVNPNRLSSSHRLG